MVDLVVEAQMELPLVERETPLLSLHLKEMMVEMVTLQVEQVVEAVQLP
tara:strand:+ start:252 stop:398 length:147 start_codon:yes stop_codon:yes gene_type:complete